MFLHKKLVNLLAYTSNNTDKALGLVVGSLPCAYHLLHWN